MRDVSTRQASQGLLGASGGSAAGVELLDTGIGFPPQLNLVGMSERAFNRPVTPSLVITPRTGMLVRQGRGLVLIGYGLIPGGPW